MLKYAGGSGEVHPAGAGEAAQPEIKSPGWRAVALEFTFDPAQVSGDTTPSVYYYDAFTFKWIELGGRVSGNTISVIIGHFTLFAFMYKTETAAIPQPITPQLSDIDHHWAKTTIEFLLSRGIISGNPDKTFRPDKAIMRAEFVTY